MELNAERPVTKQEKEGEFMGKIGAQVEIAQRRQRSERESGLQDPGQGEGRKKRGAVSLLRVKGRRTPGENGVRGHQDADQREQENRIRGTMCEARGREEEAANDGDSHAEKDDCRCVIPHRVVQSTGFDSEPVRDAES